MPVDSLRQPRTQATPEGSPAPSGEREAHPEKWTSPQARALGIGASMGRDTIPQWCVWMWPGPDAGLGLAVWGWSVLAGVSGLDVPRGDFHKGQSR